MTHAPHRKNSAALRAARFGYAQARAELVRMEQALAETQRTIETINHALRRRAETTTRAERPKKRQYGRHATTWTPADERHYRVILDDLEERAAPELARLERRAERQNAAIEILRRKYGFNEERPLGSLWWKYAP